MQNLGEGSVKCVSEFYNFSLAQHDITLTSGHSDISSQEIKTEMTKWQQNIRSSFGWPNKVIIKTALAIHLQFIIKLLHILSTIKLGAH